jgi:hypothetical protein
MQTQYYCYGCSINTTKFPVVEVYVIDFPVLKVYVGNYRLLEFGSIKCVQIPMQSVHITTNAVSSNIRSWRGVLDTTFSIFFLNLERTWRLFLGRVQSTNRYQRFIVEGKTHNIHCYQLWSQRFSDMLFVEILPIL